MSESFPYADIVVLALIAGFIILRLRSVLGQDRSDFMQKSPLRAPEPVVQVLDKALKAKTPEESDPLLANVENSAIAATIASIKEKDPGFTLTAFMQGAKLAFEMVFDAFAKGDRPTLSKLLTPTLSQHFCTELDLRDKQTNKNETTLVSVVPKEITQAALTGTTARLTVKFVSEQVTVVRAPGGEIVEGNASQIHHAENEWVFERDVTSKNPNWKIVET